MNAVQACTSVMIRSAKWVGPLTSPVAALAATKVVAVLWTFPLHG